MARLISYRKAEVLEQPRFEILRIDKSAQILDVLDRITKTVYTVQAAGNTEFQTMLDATQARWVQICRQIEG